MADKLLMISPVPVYPFYSGNRQRIRNVCLELMNHGYELDFFYSGYDEELAEEHRQFFNGELLEYRISNKNASIFQRVKEIGNGMRVRADRFKRRLSGGDQSAMFNKGLNEYKNIHKMNLLEKQIEGKTYRAVIVNYAVYSFYLDFFSDDTVKILDTHDRLTNRYQMYLKDGTVPPNWHSLAQQDERKALYKADIVWAITEEEATYFTKLVAESAPAIINVPHLIDYRELPQKKEDKHTLLTVGGRGKINIKSLQWFFEKVWPEVIEAVPEAKLIVAGSICDEREQFPDLPGIVYYGKYEEEEEVYTLSDFCINPIRFGTGLKIKTLEGLSFGKRVLTTEPGAAGLQQFEGKGLFIENSSRQWIEVLKTQLLAPQMLQVHKEPLREEVIKLKRDTTSKLLSSITNSFS